MHNFTYNNHACILTLVLIGSIKQHSVFERGGPTSYEMCTITNPNSTLLDLILCIPTHHLHVVIVGVFVMHVSVCHSKEINM